MGEVLILGAGFSHAVNECMPLTDDLGNRILDVTDLRGDPRAPANGFGPDVPFETWLSLLAEDQPYLATSNNIESRQIFERVLRSLTFLVSTEEMKAIGNDAPPWFYDLLSVLHFTRATAISFNYDTLVEVGVTSHRLLAPDGEAVTARDVLWDVPPIPRAAESTWADLNRALRDSFRLLKLHGSLDWWWVPGDVSGATLNRGKVESTFGNVSILSEKDQFRQFGGRERFIVAPLATKSSYYRNPTSRALWLQAAEALMSADRIALVGYSLPVADMVVNGMLGLALRTGSRPIDIVNPNPGDLPRRLVHLGADPAQLEVVDSVESFTDQMCDRASGDLTSKLGQLVIGDGSDTKLLVTWGHPNAIGTHAVKSIRKSDDDKTVELLLDDDSAQGATATHYNQMGTPVDRQLPALDDLTRAARDAERLVARLPDNRRVPVVGCWSEHQETGESLKWLALAPAGRPPK